jgi:4-amino-4-deoxy-L-arabinose transferase-like glycosyltransferase
VAREAGGGGLSFFILTDHVGRLLGGPAQGHVRPFPYYLPNLLLDFFPWSLVLPFTLAAAWRRRTCPMRRFALVWAVVMVGALSLSATKRAHYLLPAYPAFAVLTAQWWLDATTPLERVGRGAALAVVAVVAPPLVLGLLGLAPGPAAELFAAVERSPRAWLAFLLRLRPPAAAWAAAAVVAALAVGALRAERARRPRLAAAALIACLTAVHVAITWVVLPVLNPATSIRPVAERLAALSERGVQVLAFRFRESEALSPVLFYAGRRFPAVDDVGELARRLRERPGCALLQVKDYAALPELATEFGAQTVGVGSARVVLLSAGGGCDGP